MSRRKWLIGAGVFLLLSLLLTWVVCRWLTAFSQEDFRSYIRSYGPWAWAVMLGLQILQVFVALIPGELLESAAGFVFGPWWGTVICYVGVALASSLVFLLTRRFGIKLVEAFADREKLLQLRFLNTQRKREGMLFLLFFLPGTPKDLLTYFVGLTDISLGKFLLISLVARFPSIISSTLGGNFLGQKQYASAFLLYGITAVVSIAGLLAYNAIVKKRKN